MVRVAGTEHVLLLYWPALSRLAVDVRFLLGATLAQVIKAQRAGQCVPALPAPAS